MLAYAWVVRRAIVIRATFSALAIAAAHPAVPATRGRGAYARVCGQIAVWDCDVCATEVESVAIRRVWAAWAGALTTATN